MKENICTIPINDIFKPKDGCPMCRMEKMLEEQYVEFITGDAMMEPNIRIETNDKGFCKEHFNQMIRFGKKLPNALMLETHLQEYIDKCFAKPPKGKPDKKQLETLEKLQSTCYVCDRIEHDMYHLMSTVFVEWQKGEEFRRLYKEQPYICLKHYIFILKAAQEKNGIPTKMMPDFYSDTYNLTQSYMKELKNDITHFCSMYDYRNRGGDWGNSKDSIERSVAFLTGGNVTEGKNGD